MRLIFSFNMDEDKDRNIEFPDLQSGATGFCYSSRRPIIANLKSIANLRRSNPKHYADLFGMDPTHQDMVRKDRTWLACVPIFDPYEVHFETQRVGNIDITSFKHKGYGYCGLETEIDGPLLGTLNLDTGWDYGIVHIEEDPNLHFYDRRIHAIMAIMQASSFKIARTLIDEFPQ